MWDVHLHIALKNTGHCKVTTFQFLPENQILSYQVFHTMSDEIHILVVQILAIKAQNFSSTFITAYLIQKVETKQSKQQEMAFFAGLPGEAHTH